MKNKKFLHYIFKLFIIYSDKFSKNEILYLQCLHNNILLFVIEIIHTNLGKSQTI